MAPRFGTALKAMRHDEGLSQLDLAATIGTTQRHVSFLETGRSRPSADFVVRLATGLGLSLPQRAALFDAAGLDNPYRREDFGPEEMERVLDLLERRALRHWPFPGFVLGSDWTVLRANGPGQQMLAGFLEGSAGRPSMFEVFLSPAFRARVENWEEVSLIFYFRMQEAAARFAHLAERFARARAEGLFDHLPAQLAKGGEVPPFVPAILKRPDGARLALSSFTGHLASVHEAAIAGLEVELMVPMDEETEACLLGR